MLLGVYISPLGLERYQDTTDFCKNKSKGGGGGEIQFEWKIYTPGMLLNKKFMILVL